MNHFLTIEDTTENKISLGLIALFLCMLPFDRFYSEIVLLVLLAHTLVHITKERISRVFQIENLILSSVLLLNIAGLAWSQHKQTAVTEISRQLAILLLPIILSATGIDLNKYKTKFLIFFSAICTITVLYLYVDAFRVILYFKLPLRLLLSNQFINHNFSAPVNIHATYFSMYVSLAAIILTGLVAKEKNRIAVLLYSLAITILLAGLFQLASRSVILVTGVFLCTVMPFFVEDKKRRLLFITLSICVSVAAYFLITRTDAFNKRYVIELRKDLTPSGATHTLSESRVIRWESAWQIIKKSPVIGHGSGSEKALLKEQYFNKKLYLSYLEEFNAHNQYLGILIKTGFVGLFIFLFTLIWGARAAWKQKNISFIFFIIQIAVVSISENIMEVNKGIFFYAFFFSFFLKSGKPNPLNQR
jgi:O-antigen ligase